MAVAADLPLPSFKWPQNLLEIGLDSSQVKTLELVISQLRNKLLQTDKKYMMEFSGQTFKGSHGVTFSIPRRVIVYRERSIVVLNSKGPTPLKNESDGTVHKWGYSPDEERYYLKKPIVSSEQKLFIDYLRKDAPQKEIKGFAEIHHVDSYKETSSYFQVYYPSLSTLFSENTHLIPAIDSLYYFQRALKTIHGLLFNPASLTDLEGNDFKYGLVIQGFIGDISPENVGFGLSPHNKEVFECKFTCLGSLANIYRIVRNPGWNAPEVVQLLQTKPSHQVIRKFNIENGAKCDTWSFALLTASILLGGNSDLNRPSICLPKLTCIQRRLGLETSGIDDSDLVNLQQHEIDLEINQIMNGIDVSTPIGRCEKVWWSTIGIWLKVDPTKRPDLTRLFID